MRVNTYLPSHSWVKSTHHGYPSYEGTRALLTGEDDPSNNGIYTAVNQDIGEISHGTWVKVPYSYTCDITGETVVIDEELEGCCTVVTSNYTTWVQAVYLKKNSGGIASGVGAPRL